MGIFQSFMHDRTMKKRARFLPEEGAQEQKAQRLVREAKEEHAEEAVEPTKPEKSLRTHVSVKQKDISVEQKLRKVNIETEADYLRRVSQDRIRSRYIKKSIDDD